MVKRDGRKETVSFDKITARISHLCYGLDAKYVEPILIAQKVITGVYPGAFVPQAPRVGRPCC